ncbi:MAG: GNAT family N-acetyltransferase [Saprospiraceae bacterium]
MKIFAETKRLLLREITEDDIDGLFELDSNPEVHRFLGKQPIISKDQLKPIIAMIRQQYIDNGIGRWAIEDKLNGDFIGWTGLKFVTEEINHHINYYDLGYRLIQKFWGKGIGTESALASVRYGFETINLNQIFGMCESGNVASKAILFKCNFQIANTFEYEGKEHCWFKIERPHWLLMTKSHG